MLYNGLALVSIIVGSLLLLGAVRLMCRQGWFVGWLRGTCGILFLVLGGIVGVAAVDIYSYRQLLKEHPIATLSFTQLNPQHFKVKLADTRGVTGEYVLYGDQWQLDARLIKWKDTLSRMGAKPGYRLERLSGRFHDIEKEKLETRSLYALSKSHLNVDVWAWLYHYRRQLPWIDVTYGSATYMPMADKASYDVFLTHNGLLARPQNEAANRAVEKWQ